MTSLVNAGIPESNMEGDKRLSNNPYENPLKKMDDSKTVNRLYFKTNHFKFR